MHPVSKSPASDAQLKANRANAKRSTGPTSAEGKSKVRHNSLRHGLSGHTVVIPEHEREAFLKHLQDFRDEYRPKGVTEAVLVQTLADTSWATQQIRSQSNNFVSILGSLKNEIGCTENPETHYAINQAKQVAAHIQTINLLGVYEQRKMRQFSAARRELVQLQAERKAMEKEELQSAAAIRKAAKAIDSKWIPSQDGFVCSIEELDRFIARRDRLASLAAQQTTTR